MIMTVKLKLAGGWPKWMDPEEARICNKLITGILTHGYLVRVRDGEEGDVLCPTTVNRLAIQRETNATGITLYDVMDALPFREGQPLRTVRHARIGTFVLIHGNGEDVISDVTWRTDVAECEAVMAKIESFVGLDH